MISSFVSSNNFYIGNFTSSVELTIPTAGCGVRTQPLNDGTIEISVQIIIQMDGKLRQSADVRKIARCIIPSEMMGMNLDMMEMERDRKTTRYEYILLIF